jgi:predicted phosphodiesterase
MKYRNERSWLAWLAIISGGLAIAFAIFVLSHLWEHSRIVFPKNLGNAKAPALLSQYSGQSDLLEFAIVGDINGGMETFESVIARLREEKTVDFLVLLGDCAADPSPSQHDYFIREFSETGLTFPSFIVAGNHDVEPGRFEYSDFEALYGPANFTFKYHGNLFIGLGGIYNHEKLQETLTFLETTLRENRPKVKKVFVFMHYTAAASEDIPTQKIERSSEFQYLFEKYKVTYVFSGHYHRLARTEVNGVVYFVTGGGGARLRHDKFADIGLFHHLTIVKVRGDNSTAEQIIPIERASVLSEGLEKVERWGLTVLIPYVKEYPAISGLAAIIILALFVWGVTDRYRLRIQVMEPFIAHHYHALLTRQGLQTLEGFWSLPRDWVEDPNERRNGWSGVSRHTFFDEAVGRFSIFVKRQENHNYRSLSHPIHGRPTLFRDFCNICRIKQINAPTVEPVFYGERQEGNKLQAVLATIALEGYSELNSLFQNPAHATSVRRAILHRLADVVQMMHRHHLQHNSLGGNHVLVKLEEDGTFDLRILDLEKTRRNFMPINTAVRDLEKFLRHTPTLTSDECAELLLHYTRYSSHAQRRKLVRKINQRLRRKCSRKGMDIPVISLAT